MNIDQQVAYLMRGTQYGDEELAKSMANELRQRLIEAEVEGRPLQVYCGYDPRTTDIHIGRIAERFGLSSFSSDYRDDRRGDLELAVQGNDHDGLQRCESRSLASGSRLQPVGELWLRQVSCTSGDMHELTTVSLC